MNNKNWLKLCSLVLALMLCLTSFGTLVFADDENVVETYSNVTVPTAPADNEYDAWDGTYDTTFYQTLVDSTDAGTYTIDTAEKLCALSMATYTKGATAFLGYVFNITKDLDLSAHEWVSIGTSNNTSWTLPTGAKYDASIIALMTAKKANSFAGTLQGAKNGVADAAIYIKGMTISSPLRANHGLIGVMDGGAIKNIVMDSPSITTSLASSGFFVGYSRMAAPSTAAPTFDNLHVLNGTTVVNAGVAGVGAIVGYSNNGSAFSNCSAEFVLTANIDGVNQCGGIAGYSTANTSFTNCVADFTFDGYNSEGNYAYKAWRLGGIDGGHGSTRYYNNCDATVDITFAGNSGDTLVGGITGFNRKAIDGVAVANELENCSARGSITLMDNSDATAFVKSVGGIIGVAQGLTDVINCVSDVDITVLTTAETVNSYIGGIVGYNLHKDGGTYDGEAIITGCVALGTITVKNNAKQVGGIVGLAGTMETTTISNCYFGGTINTQQTEAGGIVGTVSESTALSITNCQMDGIVNSTATQAGAVIGRWNLGSAAAITLENVIVTGISANNYGSIANRFAWVGTAAQHNKTGSVFSATNCYSNAKMPYIGWNDMSEEEGLSSLTVNGTLITGTVNGAYAEAKPILMANQWVWMMNENWDTTGATPVLKIAKDIVNPFAGADLSWFDPASETLEYTIADKADALGVAMLGQLARANSLGYTYTVADASILTAAKAQAGVDFGTQNDNIVLKNGDATVMNDTLAVKYQTKGDSIRLIASIGNEEVAAGYEKVGFKLTYGGQTATLVTTTVYQTIVADGENVNAAAVGYSANSAYLYVVTLEGVPAEAEFIVEAFVVTANGTVTGEAYTFCLNALN